METKLQMKIFENQQVLVTGGTGMVGIALVKLLQNYKAKITVVSLDDFNPFDADINLVKMDLGPSRLKCATMSLEATRKAIN